MSRSRMEEHIYKAAKKKVEDKKGFFGHLGVYISVGLFFLAINLLNFRGEVWFFYPLLPWGMGLMIHYFSVFGLPGLSSDWEEKELRKEINKLRSSVEMDEDYEEDYEPMNRPRMDEELELKEFKKLRREWDDSDFV
ncbi:MAG: 2TM domain-containing protein [Bacteroidota bacterium]